MVLAIAGCAAGAGSSAGPGSPGSSLPLPPPSAGGTALSAGALRLSLIDQLGPLWYCDRDAFPAARDEQEAAIANYAAMAADTEVFPAVAAKLGIDPKASPSDAQKLELYRLWKAASAVALDPVGDGRYRFDYLAQPAGNATQGTRTAGTIDAQGSLHVEQQAPADAPMCPICLSIGTPIEGPSGAIAVDRLRVGDSIWTLDREGRRVLGTVIAVGSTPAPPGHRVLRLSLADGRVVTASPGHPLADHRTLADLRVGDMVDGSAVTGLANLAYEAASTYDLVVSGETGVYLAGGIPLGSTIDGPR
ncbi:MAG TPA: hypothetical protein VHR16_06375 [Candidatus Limnocylindrales bacterium]|nr:hypothetical protein [Candidatus Limnocylindrales bacterium]